MEPEFLRYYAHRTETFQYAVSPSAAHTMPSQSLRRYVVNTKFSSEQAVLIRGAVTDRIPIEVHGIYSEHVHSVLEERNLRIVASAVRPPRRHKKYNVHRPLVLRVSAGVGMEKLMVIAFPSPEYVQQVCELSSAFAQWASEDAGVEFVDQPLAVHYEYCDQRLEDWSGLRAAASQVIKEGDLVVLGYVDEIGQQLESHGYLLGQIAPIDGGRFGEIVVAENRRSRLRAVLVGVFHTYWGSAAGRISASLASAGATDVLYISKAGTLIGDDYVHKVVNPDVYYVFQESRGRRDGWARWDVPSRLRSQFPELVAGLGSGAHLTVPSVVSQTIRQSEQYRALRPATIDNEAGYIARELSFYNQGARRRSVSFSSIHFLTDYLHTSVDARAGEAKYDLSSVSGPAGSDVRRVLDKALVEASAIVAAYLQSRTKTVETTTGTFVPYPLPAVSNWHGRSEESAALVSTLVSRSQNGDGGAVQVVGSAGVGKTRLVSTVCRQLVEDGWFEAVVWVSLRPDPATGEAPILDTIIERLYAGAAPVKEVSGPIGYAPGNKLDALLSRLTRGTCLLVFDDVESILETRSSTRSGYFARRYPDYGQFFRALVERSGQSIVVILSRERLAELQPPWCLPRKLAGLDVGAAVGLLRALGLKATDEVLSALAARYDGNPKALELVTPIVLTDPAFAGAADVFLKEHKWVLTADLSQLLSEVFARLSDEELQALQRIAVYDTDLAPLRAPALVAQMPELPMQHVHDVVIQALLRRNLLDEGQQPGTYSLHPLVQEMALRSLAEIPSELRRAHRLAYEHLYRIPTKDRTEWRTPSDVANLVAALKHACAAEEWLAAAQIACDEGFRRSLVKWGAHPWIVDAYQALSRAPAGIERMANSESRAFRAITANMIGISLRNLGRTGEAIASFKAGLVGADDKWTAIILGNLGLALADAGLHADAIDVASQARDLAIQVGDRRALSYALGNLGIAYFYGPKKLAEAREALEADLQLGDGSNQEGEAHAHAVLGAIALQERQFDEAARRLRTGLRTFRSLGNSYREKEFLPALASVLEAESDSYGAAVCVRRCQALSDEYNSGEVERISAEVERLTALLDDEKRQELRALSDLEISAAVDLIISPIAED